MEILLYAQQKCYLNLIIYKLKYYFKNMVHIFICMNLQELRFYDNQMIRIVIIIDNDLNLEMVQQLKITHCESEFIFVGKNYVRIQEIIKLGVKDYLIMPIEVDALCDSIKNIGVFNDNFSLPMKGNCTKHVFELDEIKYVEKYYDNFFIITVTNECFITSIKSCHHILYLFYHSFMQVNQSIMINIHYVDYFIDDQVVLKSHENFQISYQYLKNRERN